MSYRNTKIILFNDVKGKIEHHIDKLQIFTLLNLNDKFGKYDEIVDNVITQKYFITVGNIFQKAVRLYYGQDRKQSCKYLKTDFELFAGDLDNLLVCLETTNNYDDVNNYVKKVSKFINDIIPGLHSIKGTYPDYKEICNRVDSILLVLIDFKEDVKRINKKKISKANLDTLHMCQSMESINRMVQENKQRSNSFDY